MSDRAYTDGGAVAAIIILIIMVLGFVLQPYFEMRTFNKFSKVKANYFDAVVGQLRITPNQ